MTPTDIRRIREAGLITADQEQAIVAHFKLDHDGNRFLTIVGIIGAILVSAGIILLIASNWESIPRLVKVASGILLLLLSHGLGAWLSKSDRHPVLAAVCHLLGSGMFLANIALIGQVYHLSSRPPNAILLWLAGIIPLAWILRSRTHHILSLVVALLWLGMEMNSSGGAFHIQVLERQFPVYLLTGILINGVGLLLSRFPSSTFGTPTEKFGLLVTHIAAYPYTLGLFFESRAIGFNGMNLAFLIAGMGGVLWVFVLPFVAKQPNLQWARTWCASQVILLGLAWTGVIVYWSPSEKWPDRVPAPSWIAALVLFVFCLVQVRFGLFRRSPWMVNLAIVFIGIHIATAYFQLFGSMQATGMMFVVSGLFLIGLAYYLDRNRRKLMARMSEAPAGLD